ncbi:MAG: DUF309 domain-containing protein [Planctomycetes bacterium]|nr:DUF309 domain-containing protein [Planctomycetota bacterium]
MPAYGEPLPPYPERYAKGVWLFNNRHFFECHEILEELWLESIGTEKIFYQMIIHAAVCFVHWENGNRKGVLSLQHTFKQKAAQVAAATYMGLDIAKMLQDMAALVEPLRHDANVALAPLESIVTPILSTSGFEPLPVDERELLVLGRHIEESEA